MVWGFSGVNTHTHTHTHTHTRASPQCPCPHSTRPERHGGRYVAGVQGPLGQLSQGPGGRKAGVAAVCVSGRLVVGVFCPPSFFSMPPPPSSVPSVTRGGKGLASLTSCWQLRVRKKSTWAELQAHDKPCGVGSPQRELGSSWFGSLPASFLGSVSVLPCFLDGR